MASISVLRPVVLRLTCVAFAASVGAGCSSRTDPWPTVGRIVGDGSTASAAKPPQPRVIPEVIPRPRLFQLPPTLARALPTSPNASIAPIAFPSEESPAVSEVRSMMRDYLNAFARHDTATLASHWSENGENVNLDTGATTSGREAVHHVFATLFDREAAAEIDLDITSIRPIRDEVAVVDGISKLSCPGDAPACSRFSAVVAKQDGRWLIESIRESKLDQPKPMEPVRPLDNLSWLIGHWEKAGNKPGEIVGESDADHPLAATTHCFWSAREAYLVRSHTVAGPEAHEITEIVGWDPTSRSIRSWIFSSDGGFGEGSWSLDGARAVVLFDGTLGNGRPVSGTLTIARLGPDEIACHAVGEGIDRLLPPSCDFLRTARTSAVP